MAYTLGNECDKNLCKRIVLLITGNVVTCFLEHSVEANNVLLYRAMRCKRGLCCHAVSVCLSVRPSVRRPSVTFVDHIKTNKDIFEIFSPPVATPF